MVEQRIEPQTAILAKAKGFDEECPHMYYEMTPGKVVPIDPPSDIELVTKVVTMVKRYKNNPAELDKFMPDAAPRILKNSTHPSNVFSRPTQDLLERWLREKHGIILTISKRGNEEIYLPAGTWEAKLVAWLAGPDYYTYETAREAGLVLALNQIP